MDAIGHELSRRLTSGIQLVITVASSLVALLNGGGSGLFVGFCTVRLGLWVGVRG